jgi:hypothetical protein
MKRMLAYIFINDFADSKITRGIVETENLNILTVGVKNYEEACSTAKELAAQGVKAIELCGGFGNIGVAKVAEAVIGKVQVGVVRFDNHPGFDGESGDLRYHI